MNVKRTAFIILCAGLFSCGAALAMLTKQEIAQYEKTLDKNEIQEYLKMSLDELKEKEGEVLFWTGMEEFTEKKPWTRKTATLELLRKLMEQKEPKLVKQGHVVEQKKTGGLSKDVAEAIADMSKFDKSLQELDNALRKLMDQHKRLTDKLSTLKK